MVVQTVAYWNWTCESIEPQLTITASSQDIRTDEQILQEYQKLSPPMRRLIQKSRINIKDGGSQLPYDWMHGNGTLSPVVCMFRDVGPRPSSAHKIARHDSSKPHGPGNSFWTAMGRPPREIVVAGCVITLQNAAKMAGLTEDAVYSRMKSKPIECVLLTPRYNRKNYPYDEALAFLKSIDLYSENASVQIRQERERWEALLKARKDRTIQEKYASFCSRPMAKNVFKVLELDCAENDKVRLLAYYCAPKEIKESTRRIRHGIVDRCTNPKSDSYADYGGRGIQVDKRWIDGDGKLSALQCFVVDVGFYQPSLELDRINNDGNYERSNCRWVTTLVNNRNKFRIADITARLNAMVEAKVAEVIRQGL